MEPPVDSAAALIDREAELGALAAALAASAPAPRLVVVEGPAGIGKTALIERALERAGAVRVLRAGGERVEQRLALGLLDLLLRQAQEPGIAADAGLAAAGARLLGLLERIDVLVLDDAQWADAASLAALVYALRRLAGGGRVLVGTRSDEPASLQSLLRLAAPPFGRRLRLRGLDAGGIAALARASRVPLPAAATRRLHAHVGGNPGHAAALLAETPPEVWRDADRRLAAPHALALELRALVDASGDELRRLVEAVAVLGSGCLLADAARLAGLADGLAALELATHDQLLALARRDGAAVVEFPQPLAAAAVYEWLGPARLAALHTSAAELVDDAAEALRHLACAAVGPDDELARRLDAFACQDDELRARPDAAAALIAASRLSVTRGEREQRLLRAVDWMLLGGDAARARGFAGEVAACAKSARRDSVIGQLAISDGRIGDAGVWLAEAWRQVDAASDPSLAATIAHRTAFYALVHLRDAEVALWARRALALAPDDVLAVEWKATLALSLWRQGRRREADELLTRALQDDSERDAQLLGMRAWLRFAGGELTASREQLADAAATELRLGALEIGVVHLNVLARAHFAAGDWDEAAAVAARAVARGSELEDVSARVFAWWAAALVPSARGDWAAADELARRAAQEPADAPDRLVAIGMAQALPAAALGDAERVLRALEPVRALVPRNAIDEPGFWPWQPPYAAALVTTGRLDDAEAFLAPQERLAAAREQQALMATLATVRGRLEAARGRRDDALAALERAHELARPLGRPYALALARVELGSLQRRRGQRRAAAALLGEAAEALARLGARPALERARRELTACGGRPARGGFEQPARLTPQERAVARIVAAGRSNRETAAELQVSVKTVEVHLTRIYAKLGIASRTQLAVRMGAGAAR